MLFLDDDPVIRVLRMVLSDAEHDPWELPWSCCMGW